MPEPPHWGRDGQLFYWSSFTQRMRRANHRIEGDRFVVTAQELVWSAADSPLEVPLSDFQGRGFDLDFRGQRFLMLESAGTIARPSPPRIVLARGWAQELFGQGDESRHVTDLPMPSPVGASGRGFQADPFFPRQLAGLAAVRVSPGRGSRDRASPV